MCVHGVGLWFAIKTIKLSINLNSKYSPNAENFYAGQVITGRGPENCPGKYRMKYPGEMS